MSEMIERVARAIYASEGNRVKPAGGEWRATTLDDEDQEYRDLYYEYARASIEAMREPTKSQLEAAEDIVVGYDDFATGDGNIYLGIPGYPQKAREVWTALIDAALKETV